MPTPLADLERDLARALDAADPERVVAVRRLIVDQHPDTPAAAEAAFRLGLEALFRRGDLDAAVEELRRAVKVKAAPFTTAARVSLGLALYRQGKVQQAVFELRKAAGQKPPVLESAQALSFIVMIQRQTGAGAEADRSRAELMKALEQIAKAASPQEASMAHLWLGVEHKSDGRRDLAKKHLTLALSGALPSDMTDVCKGLIAEL